jgi:hypothetical protein
MKSLKTIFNKGAYTPKELVYMQLQIFIDDFKNKKSVFSKDEIDLKVKTWNPRNSYEINEYNKYQKLYVELVDILLEIYDKDLHLKLAMSKVNTVMTFLLYASDTSIDIFASKLPQNKKDEIYELVLLSMDTSNLNIDDQDLPVLLRIFYPTVLVKDKEIKESIESILNLCKKIEYYSNIFEIDLSFILDYYTDEINSQISLFNSIVLQTGLDLSKKNTKISLDMIFLDSPLLLESI